ncbi:MAG: hypothetical protein U0821_13640 [Chloroflexota bacterium]
MKRTTIIAEEALLYEARELANREGRTLTALVQDALRDYIDAHRKPRRYSIIGIGASDGPPVDWENLDELLAEAMDPVAGFVNDPPMEHPSGDRPSS